MGGNAPCWGVKSWESFSSGAGARGGCGGQRSAPRRQRRRFEARGRVPGRWMAQGGRWGAAVTRGGGGGSAGGRSRVLDRNLGRRHGIVRISVVPVTRAGPPVRDGAHVLGVRAGAEGPKRGCRRGRAPHLFASFIVQYSPMSKSRTSLAILEGTSAFSASNRLTSVMPHLPATRLSKKVCASCPSEVRLPRPVTTTCEAQNRQVRCQRSSARAAVSSR